MKIPIFQVDAFAPRLFAGNPASVCPLQEWLPTETMQAIGLENNQAETAFFVKSKRDDADFDLRWFTPTVEIPLCGHATLGSAFVLFNDLGFRGDRIRFHTMSGVLVVERRGDALWLDLPAAPPTPLAAVPTDALAGLGAEPQNWFTTRINFVALFASEADVLALQPDFSRLRRLKGQGVIVTAPADRDADFVSRYFAGGLGVDEDPATGSLHCILTPLFADKLGREGVLFHQAYPGRGGDLECEHRGERVLLVVPARCDHDPAVDVALLVGRQHREPDGGARRPAAQPLGHAGNGSTLMRRGRRGPARRAARRTTCRRPRTSSAPATAR